MRSPARLYVAFQASDDVYVPWNEGASNFDRMSIYVDADHSGGPWLSDAEDPEERRFQANANIQRYFAAPEGLGLGTIVSLLDPESSWAVRPPFGDSRGVVAGEDPVVTVVEFFVTPFDRFVYNNIDESTVSELLPGDIIGFSVDVTDPEDRQELPGKLYALPDVPFLSTGDGDFFADAVLLGVGESVDSAVEEQTWGRIKEALSY